MGKVTNRQRILTHLQKKFGISIWAIQSYTRISREGIEVYLNQLMRQGLVGRYPSLYKKRGRKVYLYYRIAEG